MSAAFLICSFMLATCSMPSPWPRLLLLLPLHLLIVFLHYVERLFLFSPVRDQPFPVVEVLYAGQGPAWGTEIHQDPGTGAAQERNSLQHAHLMLVYIFLIFLGPSRPGVAVIS